MNFLRYNNYLYELKHLVKILFAFEFVFVLEPIPVTPDPALKRPTHLDLMPVTKFTPKKSSNVSRETANGFIAIFMEIKIH